MKPNIKIFLLTFLLGIFSTLSAHLNPASADLVDEGKDLLMKDYEPYMADAKFSAALTLNPYDEKANFWRALTIAMTNPDLKAEFINMGLLDTSDNLALDKAHEPTMSYTLIDTKIIDNPDTASGYSEEGEGWVTNALEKPYGDDCRVHPVGTGLNKAIWTFTIPLAGTYDLSLWWPYAG
jgi:hypothetical protein